MSLKNVHIFSRLNHSIRFDDLIQSACSFFNKKSRFCIFFCQIEFIQSFTHSFSQHLLSIYHVLGPQPVPVETQMVKSIFPLRCPCFVGKRGAQAENFTTVWLSTVVEICTSHHGNLKEGVQERMGHQSSLEAEMVVYGPRFTRKEVCQLRSVADARTWKDFLDLIQNQQRHLAMMTQ